MDMEEFLTTNERSMWKHKTPDASWLAPPDCLQCTTWGSLVRVKWKETFTVVHANAQKGRWWLTSTDNECPTHPTETPQQRGGGGSEDLNVFLRATIGRSHHRLHMELVCRMSQIADCRHRIVIRAASILTWSIQNSRMYELAVEGEKEFYLGAN